jgi:glycosyltransferase involved in cell wall biosynthesis
MKRIAIVVQRYHESIVGGSEALAWQYALLLREHFQVDLLTTTALDYVTWSNDLPAGEETFEGVCIRRFSVSIGRSNYWHWLNQRLQKDFKKQSLESTDSSICTPWSFALQEEYIRHQGPYSQDLLTFLKQNWQEYEMVLFTTYLYPTSYFGINQIPASHSVLIPTLHDEPAAHLSAYRYRYQSISGCLWLTNAEKRLGQQLWEEVSGEVTAMSVKTEPCDAYQVDYPYLLYCGRIDSDKKCDQLIQFFLQYKQDYPSNLRLILTGKQVIELPNHNDIDFRGFVSEEEKFKLMAGSALFVMPSPYESFSIVILEAMAQKTPILVNGNCQVLVEHVNRSGGGKVYHNYKEFVAGLQEMLTNSQQRLVMGQKGRDYVVENFSEQGVRDRLLQEIHHHIDRRYSLTNNTSKL